MYKYWQIRYIQTEHKIILIEIEKNDISITEDHYSKPKHQKQEIHKYRKKNVLTCTLPKKTTNKKSSESSQKKTTYTEEQGKKKTEQVKHRERGK